MKPWNCLLCILIAFGQLNAQQTGWQPAPGHTQVLLWPGAEPDTPRGAPTDAESTHVVAHLVAGKPWLAVSNVLRPTLTVYAPHDENTGAAVIVFPGGGYNILAIDLEGTEVCDWLTSKGITCVLLKYRVPRSGPHWDEKCRCEVKPKAPLALEDAQRTLSLVRFHAAEWRIDPHKIGVLGFSAGGHLSVAVSNAYDQRSYTAVDAADSVSCRPDFSVVLYPGHLWSPRAAGEINPDIHVSAHTPPTFLLQAQDDPVDYVMNSIVYWHALQHADVPVELHVFPHGGHAFGLRRTAFPITGWPQLVETWLASIGMIPQ
ncbi:MAG TPA: alpha/beta hydrolase [Gemmatimonadales bacterium]|nr:alpha/beta hydrolase [Gemmatimonadales bacterium]